MALPCFFLLNCFISEDIKITPGLPNVTEFRKVFFCLKKSLFLNIFRNNPSLPNVTEFRKIYFFKSLFLNIFRNNPGLPNVTEQDDYSDEYIQLIIIYTCIYMYTMSRTIVFSYNTTV